MSEATTRTGASRGRGSSRGGRGGFSNRGGRSSGKPNGESADAATPFPFDEDNDIIELRKLYGSKVAPIKDMFQGWSDVDILYALQETDGDENLTVERIAHGAVAQWGEVSKPKKSSRAKAKETSTQSQTTEPHSGNRPSRGGRIVSDSGRGRGRGTDRGGRARARTSQPATNGARKETPNLSVPTDESNAWDAQKKESVAESQTLTSNTVAEPPATIPEAPSTTPSATKTWASMLRQSTAPKAIPKPQEPVVQKEPETVEPLPSAVAPAAEIAAPSVTAPDAEPIETPAPAQELASQPATQLPASTDSLTASNLGRVDDTSGPAPTGTAASTAADSWAPVPADAPASATATAPPQPTTQIQPSPAVPGPAAGFAAVTPKIPAGRPQHFQRRILDQEEAVRMPGNREVDRAAVQFGAFSLSGTEEDIDGDREEAETRAQPPAESPIAHPRAALPPVSQPQAGADALPPQKAPAPSAPAAAPTAPAAQVQAQQAAVSQAQPTAPTAQPFGRFGHAAQEGGAPGLGGLNQGAASASTQQQFDAFQAQQQASQQPHSAGAFSSAPGDFSSYYTADHHNRLPYNYYGQQYAQQHQQQLAQGQQQEGAAPTQQPQPQRSFGGYTNPSQPDNLSQYPQSGVGALHNQSRFGGVAATDPQSSGHTTPNPPSQVVPGQQAPAGQAPASQPQSHGQQNYAYGNHPYYNNPYYHSYYAQAYGQNYGATPYSKGAVYGAPYNMPPQAPYDHTSSPASGFQSSLHRENNGISSTLGEYGRATGAQSAHQAGLGGSSFGGMNDNFGRGPSSFPSQGAPGFNAQSQTGAPSSANDDLKPYGDTKASAGPSPSLGGARPGSAANNAPTGQPPQSNAQMGSYGGYPSHLQQGLHGSGGYGGSAGGQHGSTPYGSYGQGGFGSGGFYGGAQQQQQQQQQGQQQGQQQPQRGGWGGNYNN